MRNEVSGGLLSNRRQRGHGKETTSGKGATCCTDDKDARASDTQTKVVVLLNKTLRPKKHFKQNRVPW